MKRVLVVAPAFPPHPSPATHRARFLARYGVSNGWRVEVLSVRPEYYAEQLDHELTRLVPEDTPITRTPALSTKWMRHVGIGDIGLRSYFPMRRELQRICRTNPPHLLFIPGGPFYTFLLGADIRAEFGLPYVLDYTDPWVFTMLPTENHVWKKAYWSNRLARALEPRAVRNAAHVLAVSDGTNEGIRANYPDLPADRFSAVPFGFEASDFDTLRAHPRPNPYWDANDGNIHLVYVGAMIPHAYEVVRAVFAAMLQIRRETPGLFARLRMHFFGTTYDPTAERGLVIPVAEELGLGASVHEHPRRIPYIDALNVLTSADGILALGSTLTHYTASKIFPCILARRPLLAVFHEASTVCGIMEETNAGMLVRFSDEARADQHVSEIADALRRLASQTGTAHRPEAPLDSLEKYSAKAMSGEIFRVFERALEGSQATVPHALRIETPLHA